MDPVPGGDSALLDPALICAVDLGGTFTKMALVDAAGGVLAEDRVPTYLSAREVGDDGSGSRDWLAAEMARFVDASLPALPGRAVTGFGVVVPGIVDRGVVVAAANIGWYGMPLAAGLSERLGLPGGVDHDVRASGRAEWQLGAGRGVQNLMFVPLGTGIAAALVVDGRLLRADGYAGELGHIPVPSAGDTRCACGATGCLEIVASAAGVERTFARLTGRTMTTPADKVAGLARSGAPAAVKAFTLAGTALSEALLTALTLLGPEVIVIGGGLSGAADLILPTVEDYLTAHLAFQRRPRLAVAEFGSRAGVVGAALVGRELIAAAR
ncbi:glucokinase [Friedmanniella endophytica]|uniref:Glucokinase n=1 Tax=Microlunatus kandeliicorticis TaxID=1759536 RepID=A0A7W3ISX3_9ACTN|nr:ROK family protein [Microlunatus kandeliicorticis]MBA8794663.1 glucokinase [Microlunatus kandeliicorticis]